MHNFTEIDDKIYYDDETLCLSKARTKCICPKCRKTHFMNIHWVGHGVPRKFCRHCRTADE